MGITNEREIMTKLELVRSAGWMIIAGELDDTGPLFWSNQDGWVEASTADVFTDEEKAGLNLPLDGSWIHIADVAKEKERSRRDHPSAFYDLDMSRSIRKMNFGIITGGRQVHRSKKKRD